MNYLGHLLTLPHHGLFTLGNMLGDFAKGRAESFEPWAFQIGIRLHREIDAYTDAHPAVLHSKSVVPAAQRRLAGVLVDIFYDHFYVEGVAFAEHRDSLAPFAPQLPETIRRLPIEMLSTRWFGAYSRIEGIAQILAKMDQRRTRAVGLLGAECILEDHYAAFRSDALAFLPDVQAFTKAALLRLQSAYPEAPPAALAAEASPGPGEKS
ncbi:MAG: ACP phosphodiesterase [Bryobacter sp.]